MRGIREESKVYSATGEGKVPWVSADDIAAVAVRALTDVEPWNTEHLVLGPELLSYGEVGGVQSVVSCLGWGADCVDNFTDCKDPQRGTWAKDCARRSLGCGPREASSGVWHARGLREDDERHGHGYQVRRREPNK